MRKVVSLLRAQARRAGLSSAAGPWLRRLARTGGRRLGLNAERDLETARAALAASRTGRPEGWLALLGDKELIVSRSRASFLQFAIRGRRWIAMGGPVGAPAEVPELVSAFVRQARFAGCAPVFYAVGADLAATLEVFGFVAAKVGETAVVDLADYSLAGTAKQKLRTARNKAARDGCAFAVSTPPHPTGLLDGCRRVSDLWLTERRGAEKAFSLGRFDPAWLADQPIGVVRQGGELIAFANLWTTADRSRVLVDMMRATPYAPRAVIEFMLVEAFGWAREAGYRVFDLGMAPLAGVGAGAEGDAPLLGRLGAFVYANGEGVYGFQGLRKFKDKFQPRWEPVYIATRGRTAATSALIDVALLTSGGLRGLLPRPG